MWILFLFVFALTEVIAGEIDCDNYFSEHCHFPKLLHGIPREVDVFKALCPELSSYIQCSKDFDMKCEEEDDRIFEKPETYDNLIDLFNDMCDEGSALNEVITNNLKCFNETFSNTNCKEEMQAFREPYERDELLDEFTTTKVTPYKVHCLSKILLAGCIAQDIQRNCGFGAREVAVEIIQKSAYIESSCPSSYRETVLPSIDEFKLTEEQKTFAIAELERMKIADEA